jgi:1-acyl-sn-glycerol-3-phosphate acyltransferase
MKCLRHLYERVTMWLGLGGLALACLGWLPFALLLQPFLSQDSARRLGRLAIQRGFRGYVWFLEHCCACRFNLTALDALPAAGPLVVVANHPSLLDAVLILSRLPNAVCVMKASLLDNILFGAGARMAGYIANGAPLKVVLESREVLQAGAQLVIFPEGSRTRDFPLDTCQATAALIARRAGVPLQPVLIEFSTPYLGKTWPLFRPPELPLRCALRLEQPLVAEGDVMALTRRLESVLRTARNPLPAEAG